MKIDLENSKKLYFSLKEVSRHFNVNQSLLRFWEKEFHNINPKKTEGGTRQYSREDIAQIEMVYHLVKEKGLTLEGARQVLRSKYDDIEKDTEVIRRLEVIRNDINSLIKIFDDLESANDANS